MLGQRIVCGCILCFIQETDWEQVRAFGTSVPIEMQIEISSRVFLGFVPNPFQLQPSACFALSHLCHWQFFIQTRITFLNIPDRNELLSGGNVW
jgi:hypothetical protein